MGPGLDMLSCLILSYSLTVYEPEAISFDWELSRLIETASKLKLYINVSVTSSKDLGDVGHYFISHFTHPD